MSCFAWPSTSRGSLLATFARRAVLPSCLVSSLTLSTLVQAQVVTKGTLPKKRVHVALTEQASLIYNGDNRDTRSGDVTSLANDHFGLVNNRADAQVAYGKLILSFRLDTLWFYARPDPTRIGLDLVELRRNEGGPGPTEPDDAEYFRAKVYEAGTELSNRDINWTLPAKYSASYAWQLGHKDDNELKITLGDTYAQFGRGFVLSVRKQDSLASDTTVRGARADLQLRVDQTDISATLLAGTGNPLRIDEASGRYLGVHHSALVFAQHATEAGMPRAISTDFVPDTGECSTMATCTYAPDDLYAAQLRIVPAGVQFETQGSVLQRHTVLSRDVVRSAVRILTASQSIQVPEVGDVASLYLEGAGQQRSYESERRARGGYALYLELNAYAGPFQFLFEGKHYRAFYPLSAGIDSESAPQFNLVQYSMVPTTEPHWNTSQFENFNTCTTGGRAKVDLELSDRASIFLWGARYSSWAESVSNEECEITRANENRIWDAASGTELRSKNRLSSLNLMVGVRDDQTARPLFSRPDSTKTFYRESYLRYDALFALAGPFSLQFQGWHRYRHQTVGGPRDPWLAGQTVNALDIAPFGNLAFGIEYDSNPLTPSLYFNGQMTYRLTSSSNVSLFVGQRRGALRCVGGVCRTFPAFEGARLDLTVRM